MHVHLSLDSKLCEGRHYNLVESFTPSPAPAIVHCVQFNVCWKEGRKGGWRVKEGGRKLEGCVLLSSVATVPSSVLAND